MIPRFEPIYPPFTACNSFLHMLSFCIFCFLNLSLITLALLNTANLNARLVIPQYPILLPRSYALASMPCGLPYYTPSSLRLFLHLAVVLTPFIPFLVVSHQDRPPSSVDMSIWIGHWSLVFGFSLFSLAIERCVEFFVVSTMY